MVSLLRCWVVVMRGSLSLMIWSLLSDYRLHLSETLRGVRSVAEVSSWTISILRHQPNLRLGLFALGHHAARFGLRIQKRMSLEGRRATKQHLCAHLMLLWGLLGPAPIPEWWHLAHPRTPTHLRVLYHHSRSFVKQETPLVTSLLRNGPDG